MGQKTSSTATYGVLPHSATADEAAFRNSAQNYDFHSAGDMAYGQAKNQINDTVFEDTLPAGVGERIKSARQFQLQQNKGAFDSDAAAREQGARTAALGSLAGMTQNQYAQTGGTTYQSPNWMSLAGSAAGG